MRQLTAFIQKEWMELVRSGKFFIILIFFVFFGVMNPALAKLTPWIMEISADELSGSGLIVTEVTVDAMTSWAQFYKNVMMPLVGFIVLFSGILTAEYQKKTLVNMVTKGLSRWKIVLSKTAILIFSWTLAYWCSFGITYGYTVYYWDNSIVSHIGFSAGCIYILGIWFISLIVLMSVLTTSGAGVLMGTAAVFGVCYCGSMLVKWDEFLPTHLMGAGELLSGLGKTGDYYGALAVCGVWALVNFVGSVIVFNRKSL